MSNTLSKADVDRLLKDPSIDARVDVAALERLFHRQSKVLERAVTKLPPALLRSAGPCIHVMEGFRLGREPAAFEHFGGSTC